jgi:hypothetical protein
MEIQTEAFKAKIIFQEISVYEKKLFMIRRTQWVKN